VLGLTGGHHWKCNLAAVWGQMATGGEHAPLTESSSTWYTLIDEEIFYGH